MAGIFSHLFFTHRDKPGGALRIQTPRASGVARSLSRRNWESPKSGGQGTTHAARAWGSAAGCGNLDALDPTAPKCYTVPVG